MPAPASALEFLELVRQSNLLPESRLNEVVNRHRVAGTLPTSVDPAAALLVREGVITFFQAKQLKLGRYKRFTIGSKYRLLELIGAGGMGAVYLCEHTLMRRLVALKVLPVEKLEDKSNEERFYREARAVAALDHPNIVRAYDIDHYERLHFLVMEYVDGASLQEIIARYAMEKKPFDPIRAAHYIAQAAVGMQHGHELGMVHRDIKPGNLLLDRTGVIKVLDMGLARFFNKAQDSVTEKYDDKCVLGTADYLAPEQAVSNMVDIRADIYALGGTLYFMLTTQTPFPDGTIAAKLVAHQTREPKPVESFRSDVPAGMLAVLRKMMAKDPADRYQEPIEVAEALAEWADLPIDLPPTREMPNHCPLVQALAAPSMGSGSSAPLARVLFGSGRGVFARSDSGSSRSGRSTQNMTKTGSVNTAGYPGNRSGDSVVNESNVPVGGPVSTSRASTSPTTPFPPNSSGNVGNSGISDASGSGFTPAPMSVVVHPHRPLYIVIGVLVVLLILAGGLAAYYIGRDAEKNTDDPQTQDGSNEVIRPPTTDERALIPDLVADIEPGAVVTVEFRVESAGGKVNVHLNSLSDSKEAANFGVHIPQAVYEAAGQTRQQVQDTFLGKLIRVRGKLSRDEYKHPGIEIKSLQQILIVSE